MNRCGWNIIDGHPQDAAVRSVLLRLQWMLVLGAIEILAVSLWIDTDRIAATGFSRLALKKLPDGILFGFVAIGLALLFGGFACWSKVREEIGRQRIVTAFPWRTYGLHAALLIGFLLVSRLLVPGEQSQTAVGVGPGLTGLWFGLGLAACLTWVAGLLPVTLWHPAVKSSSWAFAAAIPLTIATWAIARGTRDSWRVYSEPTLNAVLWLLRFCGEQPVHDPATVSISLNGFSIEIESTCSGYQGFGVMAAFSVGYVWACRHRLRFPQAWLLVPLALLASLIGNVVRIAALMEIGARFSPAVALGGFHSQAGWVFLIAIAVLVVGTAQRLPWLSHNIPHVLNLRNSVVAACLTPFLVWSVIGLVSQLLTAEPGFDPLYPLRWAALLVPLWYWRHLYARLLAVDATTFTGLLTGTAAFALWMLLESFLASSTPDTASPSAAMSAGTVGGMLWLASRVVGHVAAAPLLEELAFRGYLMRRLQAFRFDEVPFQQTAWPGILISSVAFGLLHGDRWLAGTLAGLIYALTVRLTGRLSAGVLAHAVTNALLTAYVLSTGDFDSWH